MFSIIIPLYNKKRYIKTALESVINQDYKNFEIIIVDDGSTDGPYEVISPYLSKYNFIRYVYQENSGVSVARNGGGLLAKYDYVCFLDADDSWERNHLSSLCDLISKLPHCGLYSTQYRRIEADREAVFPSLEDTYTAFDDLFSVLNKKKEPMVHTNSVCIPKHVFNEFGGFVPGEKIGEDTSLWYRIASYYSVGYINNVTTNYVLANSDAVRQFDNPYFKVNWSFLSFAEGIIKDAQVAHKKRKNIGKFINRYYHFLTRNFLLCGDKQSARRCFRNITFSNSHIIDFLLTSVCFFVPKFVLKRLHGSGDKQ